LVGTLALAGVASAATADNIQPASTITYNEKLQVNGDLEATGTISFPAGVHIGATDGTGGVTYFNGSIVNDSEGSVPVTFADDVRIDGTIYRTEAGGDNALKVSDSIIPTVDDTYSLGSSSYQFDNAYFGGNVVTGGNVTTSGDVTAGGDVTVTGTLTVGGEPVTASAGAVGSAASSSGFVFNSTDMSDMFFVLYQGETIESATNVLSIYGGGQIHQSSDAVGFTNEISFGAPIMLYKATTEPYACDGDHTGNMYFNTRSKEFLGCVWTGVGVTPFAWEALN